MKNRANLGGLDSDGRRLLNLTGVAAEVLSKLVFLKS
jgi:hypothetical protein